MNLVTLNTPHDVCTGCSACAQRCPAGAISMIPDEEGFVRASVNPKACIHCNLCNKVCPVGEGKENAAHDARAAYATWNANLPELQKSSSGGLFSLFARRTLLADGVVCGAVYDNQGVVYHDLVESEAGLDRMRGSKYVQSEMRDCFPRLKKELVAGRQVLFTGTGCQVAGLRAFLGKDYENLMLLEIICEGTPSPAVWQKHLRSLCPDMKELSYLSFRDKKYGWTQTIVVKYRTSCDEEKIMVSHGTQDPYIMTMFGAITQARNCYQCKFREGRAGADVTIGDMWGLGVVAPDAAPKCGASVLLVQTPKGAAAWEELKATTGYCREIAPLSAGINNGYLYRAPVIDPAARTLFYRNHMAGVPLSQNAAQALQKANRVAILNHVGHANYGSNLTAYALQEYLRRQGYDAKVVSLRPFRSPYPEAIRPYLSFISSVLRFTPDVYGPSSCARLNKDFDTFIVGSDQVWRYPRPWIRRCAEPSFYLEFAAQGKRRIAYAASFGISTYEGPKHLVKRFYKALRDFDAVSVREHDGLDILRDRFDYTDAVAVMDPVFLLSARDWQRFTSASVQQVPDNQMSVVLFYHKKEAEAAVQRCAAENNLYLDKLEPARLDVMTWLKTLSLSRLIVTDSFHTLCFAVIFRRPFVVISSAKHGKSRLRDFMHNVGLQHRFIDLDELPLDELPEVLCRVAARHDVYASNFTNVLAEKIQRSSQWLLDAMKRTPACKKHVVRYSFICALVEKLPCKFFRYWPLCLAIRRAFVVFLLWKPGKKNVLRELKAQLRKTIGK